MTSGSVKTAVPVIASFDVAKTVNYFERVLGFEQQWIWGDPPVYAGLKSGEALLYVCRDPELAGTIQERHLAPDIYFWVDDIDSLYDRQRASNAEIIEELQLKPWGTRQYAIREPNGYLLKFAELD